MTLIEFFTKDAIENVCTSLIKAPDKVILIGADGEDDKRAMASHKRRYEEFMADRGSDTVFELRHVNENRLSSIFNVLKEVVDENEECVIDLTGGEELYLVAAGAVYGYFESRGRHLQMHRITVESGNITDCDHDGTKLSEGKAPELSVREYIKLYGGEVLVEKKENGELLREGKTQSWDITPEFKADVRSMWEICRRDPGGWNIQTGYFAAAEEALENPVRQSLGDGGKNAAHKLAEIKENTALAVSVEQVRAELARDGKPKDLDVRHRIINELKNKGLLTLYESDGVNMRVEFKNEQVKRCLTVSGQVLEMLVYVAALEAQEEDGKKTYNDAMTGVHIDWIVGEEPDGFDTENEIDVLLMHGMVPIFVSCKNGRVETEELYKLNTVAERFGGEYAKKVLVATSLDTRANRKASNSEYIRQRAEDMGILLVEGSLGDDPTPFTQMSFRDIVALIRSFKDDARK